MEQLSCIIYIYGGSWKWLAYLLKSSFPPKLLVLVDCNVVLLLHPMEEGEGEDGDSGDDRRVTSIFVMTLSHNFNFRDKAPPLGEIIGSKL